MKTLKITGGGCTAAFPQSIERLERAEMLSAKVRDELEALTPEQHAIVLGGLRNKLGFHKRSGILSYRYDVCPVCQDMGSTEEDPKCDDCYIKISCKVPFVGGFRDDPERGVMYFTAMLEFLEQCE